MKIVITLPRLRKTASFLTICFSFYKNISVSIQMSKMSSSFKCRLIRTRNFKGISSTIMRKHLGQKMLKVKGITKSTVPGQSTSVPILNKGLKIRLKIRPALKNHVYFMNQKIFEKVMSMPWLPKTPGFSIYLKCCILRQYNGNLLWSSHGFPSCQAFVLENAANGISVSQ